MKITIEVFFVSAHKEDELTLVIYSGNPCDTPP